jgi:hypothetical protein
LLAKEKPVSTHRVVAQGHAFPDHALDQRRANPTAMPVLPINFTSSFTFEVAGEFVDPAAVLWGG